LSLSLRAALLANPELDPAKGLRQMPRFVPHAGSPARLAFPYRTVRELIRAQQWPAMVEVERAPDEIDPAEWTDAINGIAVDERWWYVVTEGYFYQLPVAIPLSKATTFVKTNLGWPHGSSAVLRGGLLYVCVHGGDEPHAWPNGEVWAIRPKPHWDSEELATHIATSELGTPDAPWIAIHPTRPILYHSAFEPGSSNQLSVFAFQPAPFLKTDLVGTITLVTEVGEPLSLRRVQAAVVTPNNHLVVLCDTPESEAVSGIHLFDLQTGRRRWHYRFEREYDDEAEALLVSDFGKHGILHVGLLNKDFGRDDFSFVNFDVATPFDRWKL
jgi:hypothetical protein